jgi:hypothetical protein
VSAVVHRSFAGITNACGNPLSGCYPVDVDAFVPTSTQCNSKLAATFAISQGPLDAASSVVAEMDAQCRAASDRVCSHSPVRGSDRVAYVDAAACACACVCHPHQHGSCGPYRLRLPSNVSNFSLSLVMPRDSCPSSWGRANRCELPAGCMPACTYGGAVEAGPIQLHVLSVPWRWSSTTCGFDFALCYAVTLHPSSHDSHLSTNSSPCGWGYRGCG